MKLHNLFRMFSVVIMVTLFGCGGGGGGGSATPSTPEPAKATTAISGKVNFPSLSSLVAKRVGALAPPVVYVQAFSIDGVAVSAQVMVLDAKEDAVTGEITGSYSISGLVPGTDYVIKATTGSKILKKLVEKSTVAPDITVYNQNLSGVSTTAVAVASQKLTFTLGEPVTIALTPVQKTSLSENIFTQVSPDYLESQVDAARVAAETGNYASMSAVFADLVNTLNIVIAAVSTNVDPTKVLSGAVASFNIPPSSPVPLKLLMVDSSGAVTQSPTALTMVTSAQAQQTVTSSVDTYVPPSRVQLEISTNVAIGALYGITFDINVPADAQVKLASVDGQVDMSSVVLASGVVTGALVDAQYNSTNRKLRIVIAGSSPLPTGKLVSVVFDRTAEKPVTAANFAISYSPVDLNGQPLSTSFAITKTAISSGL